MLSGVKLSWMYSLKTCLSRHRLPREMYLMWSCTFRMCLAANHVSGEVFHPTTWGVPMRADLADSTTCPMIVERAAAEFGGIDLLINCAGLSAAGSFTEASPELWDKVFAVNAKAPFFLSQAALPYLKKSVKPTVINPVYITGIDGQLLESLKADHKAVITLEDGILDGGFGEKIARFYGDSDMKVSNLGLKKEFLDRYDAGEVLRANGLTPEQIADTAEKLTK